MKNRIDNMFSGLKQKNKKALITFITAGDPDLATTEELVLEMERQGADLVELGIPFTDPMAEGPVIQVANTRALKNDVSIPRIMELVERLRVKTQVPIVYLMYFNSILHYGVERFFKDCAKSGVDGVIIPDLPFEESDEVSNYTESNGVHYITMVSPTSEKRIISIASDAKGFLYCVSSLGVTGTREKIATDLNSFFNQIKKYSKIPNCLGFGISSPEQVSQVKQYCDGVIVGSAIVKLIAADTDKENKIETVGKFTADLKNALQ